MPTPSLSRTLRSIQSLVEQEEWYAAHQKYRTSAARLLKSNDPQSLQDSIALLFEGSKLLLQRAQFGSGTDLGLMLDSSIGYTSDERHKLLNLIALIGPKDHWRKTIIDAALAYSSTHPDFPMGDPLLHLSLAELYLKENRFELAEHACVSSGLQDSSKVLSTVLWNWSLFEKKSDHEKSLGRYASRGFNQTYPHLKQTTLQTPLKSTTEPYQIEIHTLPSLNFLQLLILTCQIGPGHTGTTIGKAVFQAMIGRYSRIESWLGSSFMKESLDQLAEMYFGIKPQRQSGNILNELMGSLFSGTTSSNPTAPSGSQRGSQVRGKPSSGMSTPALD
ncbi:hypothetical protein DFH28DRAFT_1182670 [Melampsora americana]|nr:hypothetical protein DFH28DRAFT_1182670 [Melampsora americana]